MNQEEIERHGEEIKELRDDVKDIKDNHLTSIEAWLLWLDRSVNNLRWFMLAGLAILGIVLAIIEVFG